LGKVDFFRHHKSGRQHTTFTTHSTTFSPQKHHSKTRKFSKTPCKNSLSPSGKK